MTQAEGGSESIDLGKAELLKRYFEDAYVVAESIQSKSDFTQQVAILGSTLFDDAQKIAGIRHAARGVALTLSAFKNVEHGQDIRFHKSEQQNGFSARSFDSRVTIPFLQSKSLPYNVETHWLSQTFSFAGPYLSSLDLKTVPKAAGPLLLNIVNAIENSKNKCQFANAVVEVILAGLIEERNKGRVALEKPQNLSIDQTIELLEKHFYFGYSKNSPRLPQVAIYSVYECLMPSVARYQGLNLQPLEKMKAANRKSGTVGDIDVNKDGEPFEAVEIKFDIPISREHVSEAIQKIRYASVKRYLILSTAGIANGEDMGIAKLQSDFRRSNGCEIIVNGILDTLKYYLRLIDSPSTFVNRYTARIESDEDLSYEHRLAWNEICSERLQS